MAAHSCPWHPPNTSIIYAKSFYTANMTTIERLAKKIGKESGFLSFLDVEEDDADDIVQAMQQAQMLTTKPWIVKIFVSFLASHWIRNFVL